MTTYSYRYKDSRIPWSENLGIPEDDLVAGIQTLFRIFEPVKKITIVLDDEDGTCMQWRVQK